jgi:hypothetical protein
MVVWFRTRVLAVLLACLSFPAIAADHTYDDDALEITLNRATHDERAVARGVLMRPPAKAGDLYQADRSVQIEAGPVTLTAH